MKSAQNHSVVYVLLASVIGTTIEFFDFFAYGTAAVLFFPKLFFPSSDPTSALLQSLATFSIAFFARPFGAALFGHFGDRIGRKATLVVSLLTMGGCTVLVGLLPTYASVGALAPLLLILARLGQGIALGGEWAGAVLVATENAPAGRRSLYSAFPQFGSPLGFVLSTAVFFGLTKNLDQDALLAWGWRVPFLLSFFLVGVGLYVRLRLSETPEFKKVLDEGRPLAVPLGEVFKRYKRDLAVGTLFGALNFVLFYLIAVFLLSWGSSKLGYSNSDLLAASMIGVLCEIAAVPLSGWLSDRIGARKVLILSSAGIALTGIFLPILFERGMGGVLLLYVGALTFQGFNYGSVSAMLAAPFPAEVRYSGTAMTFNLAGILGGSLVPFVATQLANSYGLIAIGYYLSGAALISIAALMIARPRPSYSDQTLPSDGNREAPLSSTA
jgi:metabolite-proton symporter